MKWSKAAAVAADIAKEWTREGGPGGAILLFDADNIRAEACGGMANLDLALPFTADSAVRYASISKHFLASLLLTGAPIALTDTLGDHLDLPPALAAVPVARALDMTGGLPDAMQTLWLLGVSPTTSLDRDALLAFCRKLDTLNFAPGAEISYSNTGYRLVQAALEAKGINYPAALHDRFFRPLGLGITLPEDETDPVPNLATGYWKSPRGWLRGRYGLHISASGGLAGSAKDLTAWCQALLANTGPADGLLAQLGAQRPLTDGRTTGYSLGLARSPIPGLVAIGHGGSLPGYKNRFILAPEHKAGVVVLSNREDTDAHAIAMRVLAALAGTTMPEPARGALPEGRFLDPITPSWLEQTGATATWLGATETLYPGPIGDNATTVISQSVETPISLQSTRGAIEGEIGHARRRFTPTEPDLTANPAWAGTWSNPTHNAHFTITVANGTATLTQGAGPQCETSALTPLSATTALTTRGVGGPWSQRILLSFTGDSVRLITDRSRVLTFNRLV